MGAKQTKRRLVEQARTHLAPGERVTVIALAARYEPWVFFGVAGVGVSLVLNGLFGSTFPTWVGVVGAALFLAASSAPYLAPSRAVLRTDRHVLVFELQRMWWRPRLGDLLHTIRLDELPGDPGGRAVDLAGERLRGFNGARYERAALGEAVEAAS